MRYVISWTVNIGPPEDRSVTIESEDGGVAWEAAVAVRDYGQVRPLAIDLVLNTSKGERRPCVIMRGRHLPVITD